MRTNDIQGGLREDFEPAQLAIGADGAPAPAPPEAKPRRDPPRLCEQGPCVHYHRFVVQLDVESAKGDSVDPGGKIHGLPHAPDFHPQTHHYCYPDIGIESDIGSLPVLSCNRWQPVTPDEVAELEQKRNEFLASEAGQKYRREMDEWKASLEAERAEEATEDPIDAWLTMNLRDTSFLEIWRDKGVHWPDCAMHHGGAVCDMGPECGKDVNGKELHEKLAGGIPAADARQIASLKVYVGTLYGPGKYTVWIINPLDVCQNQPLEVS